MVRVTATNYLRILAKSRQDSLPGAHKLVSLEEYHDLGKS